MQTETYLGIAHESLMQTIVALRDLMSHHTVHIEGLQLRRYISTGTNTPEAICRLPERPVSKVLHIFGWRNMISSVLSSLQSGLRLCKNCLYQYQPLNAARLTSTSWHQQGLIIDP